MRNVLRFFSPRRNRLDGELGLLACCAAMVATTAVLLLLLTPANSPAATPDETSSPPAAPPAAPVPPPAPPPEASPPAPGQPEQAPPAAPAAPAGPSGQSPPPAAPEQPQGAAPPPPPPSLAPGETPPTVPMPPAPPEQMPPAAPGAAPGAPTTPAAPAEAPPAAPPDTGTGAPAPEAPPAAPLPPRKPLEGPITLDFKDASLRAVLEYLSEATGLIIIPEASLEGRVTVISHQPLNVDEAVSLLNTILKDKGFAAVRTGRTLKIVALDQAKKAALPVRSGSDPEKIEPSDQLITYIIPIRSADAVQLKRDLATLIPTYADLSANAATNTLILTDTQTNVRRFVEIIHAIDTQTAVVSEVRVYQLKYANSANASRLVTDLFKVDQQGQPGGASPFGGSMRQFLFGGGPPGGGFLGGGFPGGSSGRGPRGEPGDFGRRDESGRRDDRGGESQATVGGRQQQQKVAASSDDRTNTLVVSGPPELLKVIDDIINKLDSNPSEEQSVFIYPLKNAKAANVAAVLNNLFGMSGGTTSGRTSTTSQQSSPFRSGAGTGSSGIGGGGSRSGGLGTAFGSSGMGSSGSSRGGSSGGFGSSGFGSNSSRSGTGFAQSAGGMSRMSPSTLSSASDLVGQVYVVSDDDTNSLLVTAATKNFDRIKEILADLDRPVPQVLIKVLIAEVTHEDTLDLGAEFSYLNLNAAKTSGTSAGTDFGLAALTNGFNIRVLESEVAAAIHALAGIGKLDVLSRPYILASDNQEADIMVGQEVPFITRSQLTDTGQTINTIEYDDIGIILSVTPHINPDGLVIMDVYPEISALTGQTVPISPGVNAPVFARRAAQSRVAIRNGQTIVIGGLMEDRNTDHVDKVPILGDIPWIGALFQHVTKDKTKTELLIFLTPHVARVPDDLKAMSEGEQAGSKILHNTTEPGTFEEHMQGMRQGMAPEPEDAPERQPADKARIVAPQPGTRNEPQR